MFHAREKRSRVTERLFNERQCTADDGNDEIEENVSVTDVDEIENVDEKITSYTEEIVTKSSTRPCARKERTTRFLRGCFRACPV